MSDDRVQIDIIINMQGLESINRLTGAMRGIGTSSDLARKSQEELSKANWRNIKSWGDLSGHLSRVERDLDAVWRAGVHLKALGQDLLRFSKMLTSAGIEMANAWGDFEFVLTKVAASSGIYERQLPIYDKLKRAIKDTAVEIKFLPIDEVTQAFYFWSTTTGQNIKTQKDVATAVGGVTAAIKTAIITQTGYEEAIKTAYMVVKQFGLNLSDIPHIMAVLHVQTIRTSLEFGDLTSSFQFVGSMAAALRIPFETTVRLLGMLGDVGQKGSRAGRGLGIFLTKLVRPTKDNVKAFNELMLKTRGVKDAWDKLMFPRGKFVGIEKLITMLSKSMAKMTDQERLNYLTRIASTQNAARVILPLINSQIDAIKRGADIFADPKYSVAGAQAAWTKQWNLVADSWKGATEQFQRLVDVVKLSIGERIASVMKPFITQAAEVLKLFNGWIEANPKLMDFAITLLSILAAGLAVVGTFFVLLGTFILLGAAVAFFMRALSGIIFAFTALGLVLGGVAYAIAVNVGGIRDALVGLGSEISDLLQPTRQAFNDIAVTIGDLPDIIGPAAEQVFKALAAGVNFLTESLRTIRNDPVLSELMKLFGVFFGSLVGYIATVKTLGFVIGTLTSALWALGRTSAALNALGGGLLLLPGPLKLLGLLAAAGAAIWYAYENNILGFRDAVDDVIAWLNVNLPPAIAYAQSIVDNLIAGGTSLLNTVVPAIQRFAADFGAALAALWAFVQPILQALWAPFERFINYGIPELIRLVSALYEAWAPVFAAIAEVVVGVFVNNILPAIGGFMSMLEADLFPLLREVGEWFKVAWDIVWTVVGVVIGGIIKLIVDFVIWAAPFVQGFLDIAVRIFGAAFSGILDTVTTVLGAMFQVIKGVLETIRGVIGFVVSLIKGDWKGAWESIQLIVKGILDIIVGIIRGVLGIIGGIIDTGLRVVLAIFEWIFGMEPGSIYQSIKDFIGTITKFGGDLIAGLAKGVGDAIAWAIGAIAGFIGDILRGIGDFITGKKSGGGGGGLFNQLLQIGQDIVRGLWKGLQSMMDWMIRQVQSFIRDVIPGPIRDWLGISSPSKMMAELGRYIVLGLAAGIAGSDEALIAMQRQTSALSKVAMAGADRVSMAFDSAVSLENGSLAIRTENRKTIQLEIDVTSSDGSIDSLKMSELVGLINSSELVTSIEHMAALD